MTLGIGTTFDYLVSRAFDHSYVRGQRWQRFVKKAHDSWLVFQAAKACYCENLDCECGSHCGLDGGEFNVDPRSAIEWLGRGNLCARCCEHMPDMWHMTDCRCDKCERKIAQEDAKLREAFKVETFESMDWVEDSGRSHLRRRVAWAPVKSGPDWCDD